jgi:hypothetical protein
LEGRKYLVSGNIAIVEEAILNSCGKENGPYSEYAHLLKNSDLQNRDFIIYFSYVRHEADTEVEILLTFFG